MEMEGIKFSTATQGHIEHVLAMASYKSFYKRVPSINPLDGSDATLVYQGTFVINCHHNIMFGDDGFQEQITAQVTIDGDKSKCMLKCSDTAKVEYPDFYHYDYTNKVIVAEGNPTNKFNKTRLMEIAMKLFEILKLQVINDESENR